MSELVELRDRIEAVKNPKYVKEIARIVDADKKTGFVRLNGLTENQYSEVIQYLDNIESNQKRKDEKILFEFETSFEV